MAWSWQFSLIIFAMTLGTRLVVTVGCYYLFTCCCKRDLNLKETLFMASSGALKGAICFGLMVEMSEFGVWCPYNPKESYEHDPAHAYYPVEKTCQMESVIHNCILVQVIASYLFFGTFLGPLRRWLLGSEHERKDIGKTANLQTF
jgi:hypothetical protein